MGIHRRDAFEVVARLIEVGLVSKVRTDKTNTYKVLAPPPLAVGETPTLRGEVAAKRPPPESAKYPPPESAKYPPPSEHYQEHYQEHKEGGSAPKPPVFDPMKISFPESLATDAFRTAWTSWVHHRIEIRKKLTPTSTAEQIEELAAMGAARAIAMIKHTICKGYLGLRPPDGQADQAAEDTVDVETQVHKIREKVAEYKADLDAHPWQPISQQVAASMKPSEPPSSGNFEYPCRRGANGQAHATWVPTDQQIAEYVDRYPMVDVLAECQRALEWVVQNARKRKTAAKMPAFLGKWLSEEADKIQRQEEATAGQ
jgi:hypothetical protein